MKDTTLVTGIRFTESEISFIKAKAQARGLTISSFIRKELGVENMPRNYSYGSSQ